MLGSRAVLVQAIEYLKAPYQPTARQSAESIAQLVRKLGKYELTKAEKLQIVNHAPTEFIELYVVRLSCHIHPFRPAPSMYGYSVDARCCHSPPSTTCTPRFPACAQLFTRA